MWCWLERPCGWRAAMKRLYVVPDLAKNGLTTNESPFIQQAQREGQLYIKQPYELYSEENQATWRKLYARIQSRWERYANAHFLEGIHSLYLDPERIPRLEEVN